LGVTVRRLRRFLITVITGGLVLAALYYLPTGYVLVSPGPVRDLSQVVKVTGGAAGSSGRVLLTTINSRDAGPLLYLYGVVNPKADLTPQGAVVPPGQDRDEYWEYQRRLMEESQAAAKVAALAYLGYEASLVGTGVMVMDLLPSSPSEGLLKPGDLITMVDGVAVNIAGDLLDYMARKTPGEPVRLEISRAGETKTLEVPTEAHPSEGRAIMGVLVTTAGFDAEIPLEIHIEIQGITGPSAGLMFSLEIVNQLSPGDITRGMTVAGTGTIAGNGAVGPVGGVRQKVFAAEREGAEVFLVPAANLTDAMSAASRVRVVPVTSLAEALEALEESGLETGEAPD
jgi:PDZ domain-containing protein